jgi:DNA-binding LytR/AlgR family response regulator
MNCVVIDDEPLSLQLIKSYAVKTGLLNITGAFTDALKAKPFIESNNIDLLLLDIQMPDITGLQFFSSLQNKPLVIFTTAFSQYAAEGFNLDAVDYLVKPFDYERFLKAAVKAKELLEYRMEKESNEGYLFIKYDYQWNKVYFKDIELIEALDDYIKIYISPKPFLVHMSMKTVTEKLPKEKFLRVHRSYIVPVEKISGWNKNSLRIGDKTVPVSYTYQKELQDILQKKIEE